MAHNNLPERRSRVRLRPLDSHLAERMRREVDVQTDEALMRQFGISYNTWRKVRSGDPIRASLAERLESRML